LDREGRILERFIGNDLNSLSDKHHAKKKRKKERKNPM
jgi:hypothetical protein